MAGLTMRRIEHLAPMLIDTVARTSLEPLLEKLDPAEVRASARLSLAYGRSLTLAGDPDAALAWLLRAQSATRDIAIRARATWEVGCLYLERGEPGAADLTCRAALHLEGSRPSPDVAHLAALLAEHRGEPGLAEDRYRYAIDHWTEALSPYTRVAALRNLASTLAQRDPAEAASFCGLGLSIVDADDLDPSLRPALLNILAYALLASGEIAASLDHASRALEKARRTDSTRFARYALFNLAIARELNGESFVARDLVQQVMDELRAGDELRGWCVIRLAWNAAMRGELAHARSLLDSELGPIPKPVYRASLEALEGILACFDGSLQTAIARLRSAIRSYDSQSDWLTSFALHLWLAHAYERAGRRDACARAVSSALEVGQRNRFRASPNYWHSALVGTARRHTPAGSETYVGGLLSPMPQAEPVARDSPLVRIGRGGEILIADEPLHPSRWRVGRTGSMILRRLFALLAAAHPEPVHRDELIDVLWADSDGDRAIRNLYSATNDLRHFLHGIPGVVLELVERGYRLRTEPNVVFLRSASDAAGAAARAN